MAENIELHSFCKHSAKESDIEEYHEINQAVSETAFSPKYSSKTLKHYDFFTEYDAKTIKKGTVNKNKSKRKEKPPNLMDIISTEMASVAVPIVENVISRVDSTVQHNNILLVRSPRIQDIMFHRKPSYMDSEHGCVRRQEVVNLHPIFPRVLDNAKISEDLTIPIEYVEPAMFNDLITENIYNKSKPEPKFLDIELQNLKFIHHHQFSLEQLLCVKLVQFYNEYKYIQKSLKDIVRDIKVNRETKDSLKQELIKISPSKKEDIRFDQTIRKYSSNLIQLKETHLQTLRKQKELIHKLTSLWSDIEMVRERSEYRDTSYNLIITKSTKNNDEFEEEWNEVFETEFADMLDKMEFEYVNKYIEYKEVKYTQNLDDSSKRRISKPKLQIDEDTAKEEVESIVNYIIHKDRIDIIVKEDDNIYKQLNKSENVKWTIKNKYYFQMYVDDVFVCESEHYNSKKDKLSEIEFNESFSVQILPKNTTMRIVLSENERPVSTVEMKLSEIKQNNINAEFVTHKFVYDCISAPNVNCVGSGHSIKEIAAENKIRLKSNNIFKGNLYTTCDVTIKMGWNYKLSESHSEAIKSSMEIGRQLKRLLHGIEKPNVDVLGSIISKIYGKDVANDEVMINSLTNICKGDVATDDSFPIDENSPEYTRLRLLHLRNIGGLCHVENKLIPIHASQITTEQLNCLHKSEENEFDVQYFNDKYVEMDPIELQRFIGMKYVQKLNKNMLKNLNEYLLRKTHKDVVRDFKDLSLRGLFTSQTNLASLATMSSNTKQQLLTEALTREQEIRITVLRAFNLTDRSVAVLTEDEEGEDSIAGFKVRPLRPFVRVSYLGAAARTVSAIGCHPSWNQTLNINTKFEPLSSIHVNIFDEHKVNASEGLSDDDSRGATVHYRCYNKWLGTLHVPLRTVLALGTVRGNFKLSTPPMLFGYENITNTKQTNTLIPEVTQMLKKDTSFISLQITTKLSHLGGLHSYDQPIPNSEDDYVINHLNMFVTEYINDFPSRNIYLTFIDSSGRNKCVTQFLQPIPLPDAECFPKNPKSRSESAVSKSSGHSKSSSSTSRRKEEEISQGGEERESLYSAYDANWRSGESQIGKLMNAALRYVSLIPTYEVTESHVVTLLGLELLKVLHGSPLDHTLLLASYFLHLGIRCYVAVGMGLPRGHSSYVLTKYDLTTHRMVLVSDQMRSRGLLNRGSYVWHVYDATSGDRSELRDVGCPLKTVDFVFDNENIWVNMQSSLDCESVSFDFTRSSDWRPVFDKTIFVMKQPVVTEGVYSSSGDVERLRLALETRVRDKVQRWRTHMKTIWNRYCSSLLREMLPHWEYWSFHPSEPRPALSQRMRQLMATYKIFGFPLNVAYVNSKSVISSVKSTGVHACADPNAEFALAVEVCAYPNNVLSAWVFLASVTRL